MGNKTIMCKCGQFCKTKTIQDIKFSLITRGIGSTHFKEIIQKFIQFDPIIAD